MKYSKFQILKAAELSGLSEAQAMLISSFLDIVTTSTLEDLLVAFCLDENINKEEFLSKKRSNHLFEYRVKFTKLAKSKFGKEATQEAIGIVLNRDHASVTRYLKLLKAKEQKIKKTKKLKFNGTPFNEWPKKYELTNLLRK